MKHNRGNQAVKPGDPQAGAFCSSENGSFSFEPQKRKKNRNRSPSTPEVIFEVCISKVSRSSGGSNDEPDITHRKHTSRYQLKKNAVALNEILHASAHGPGRPAHG